MDPELIKAADTAFKKAKFALLNDNKQFFMATVFFSLDFKWDSSCPTLATDGLNIEANPQFFVDFSPKDRVFGLLHETWHVALQHNFRRGDRNPKIWNFACDYSIHSLMKKEGLHVWERALYDPKYDDKSAEEIYKLLMDEVKQKSDSSGEAEQDIIDSMQNPMGDDLQQPGNIDAVPTPQQIEAQKEILRKIDDILVKAATLANIENKSIGNLPDYIQQRLGDLLNPTIPWPKLFRNWMTSQSPDDYSMTRPNKRFMPHFHMPSLYSKSLGEVVCMCDASGSVGEKEFTKFFSECAYIKRILNPQKFTVASWDTDIRSVYTFRKGQKINVPEFKGGGGTDIDPVLRYLNNNKPEIAVIFTDGDFYAPTVEYRGKLLWLVYNNPRFTAPFGKVIHFKQE